jgi:hypothetical protein
VYALILFFSHGPVQDWIWYLGFYIVQLAGPLLIGYGIRIYPEYQVMVWIGSWAILFLLAMVATFLGVFEEGVLPI